MSPPKKAAAIRINEDPFPSTYAPYPGVPTVIRNATVFDGEGGRIEGGTVVLAGGVVQAVGGPELPVPDGAQVIDGTGKFVTPGIIDVHSHLGDYPSPGTESH
ncbi:MAG: amidohydrolase, partial [Alphaproteobacteria bacterium]